MHPLPSTTTAVRWSDYGARDPNVGQRTDELEWHAYDPAGGRCASDPGGRRYAGKLQRLTSYRDARIASYRSRHRRVLSPTSVNIVPTSSDELEHFAGNSGAPFVRDDDIGDVQAYTCFLMCQTRYASPKLYNAPPRRGRRAY